METTIWRKLRSYTQGEPVLASACYRLSWGCTLFFFCPDPRLRALASPPTSASSAPSLLGGFCCLDLEKVWQTQLRKWSGQSRVVAMPTMSLQEKRTQAPGMLRAHRAGSDTPDASHRHPHPVDSVIRPDSQMSSPMALMMIPYFSSEGHSPIGGSAPLYLEYLVMCSSHQWHVLG